MKKLLGNLTLILLLIYVFFYRLLFVQPVSAASFTYTESSSDIPNPERGFMKQVSVHVDQAFTQSQMDSAISVSNANSDRLVWVYFWLDKYRDPNDMKAGPVIPESSYVYVPINQVGLNTVQAAFTSARSKGLKLVIRFIYNNGPGSSNDPTLVNPDVPLSVATKHMDQLAPIISNNADVIAAFQAGFVGHWGEWHSSKYLSSLENRKAITDKMLAILPPNLMIQMRYPKFVQRLYGGPITAAQAFNQTDLSRIGFYDDAVFKDGTDDGTFTSNMNGTISTYCANTDAQCWRNYFYQTAQYAPAGGEAGTHDTVASSYAQCVNAVPELGNLHFSFLHDGYAPVVLNTWTNQGCMPEIRKRLGYRLVLKDATIPNSVVAGGNLNMTINVTNVGFAALYSPRPIFVVLQNASNRYNITVDNNDPRKWIGGKDPKSYSVPINVTVPSNVINGTYKLALWLPDNSVALRTKTEYSVQFANTGTWDSTNGYNVLTTGFQVGNSTTPQPTGTTPIVSPSPEPRCTPDGNINCDSKVDSGDIISWLRNYLTDLYAADLNNDGRVTAMDYGVILKNLIPTGLPTTNPSPTLTKAPTKTPTPSLTKSPTPLATKTPTPLGPSDTPFPTTAGEIATDQNLKVAFIGDSAAGDNFQTVINMIKAEGADMVIHAGDLDYEDSAGGPSLWRNRVDTTFGVNFPYFASDGNHDNWQSDGYQTYFTNKVNNVPLDEKNLTCMNEGSCTNNTTGGEYTFAYHGLKMVITKEDGDSTYVNNALNNDKHIWKICTWHKIVTATSVGFHKTDSANYAAYEACRQQGAIIINGHNHVYSRTKTLTLINTDPTVNITQHPLKTINGIANVPHNEDLINGTTNNVLVGQGNTFVAVVGTGGKNLMTVDNCAVQYPYQDLTKSNPNLGLPLNPGCDNLVYASILSKDQVVDSNNAYSGYGAFFITFNVNGNPKLAQAYFKDTKGKVIDKFTITRK